MVHIVASFPESFSMNLFLLKSFWVIIVYITMRLDRCFFVSPDNT